MVVTRRYYGRNQKILWSQPEDTMIVTRSGKSRKKKKKKIGDKMAKRKGK